MISLLFHDAYTYSLVKRNSYEIVIFEILLGHLNVTRGLHFLTTLDVGQRLNVDISDYFI